MSQKLKVLFELYEIVEYNIEWSWIFFQETWLQLTRTDLNLGFFGEIHRFVDDYVSLNYEDHNWSNFRIWLLLSAADVFSTKTSLQYNVFEGFEEWIK